VRRAGDAHILDQVIHFSLLVYYYLLTRLLGKRIQVQATAFIVGQEEGVSEGIMDLCMEIGFRAVVRFSKIEQAEQQVKRTPICYFLFSAEGDEEQFASVSKAVRFSRNRQVRFAPMVCFAENPSQSMVRMCIQEGFDDIVAPPFSAKRVARRFNSLLECRLMFYETPTYFGPDRRKRLGKLKSITSARGSGGKHRRIEITRNVDSGINILHDHFYRGNVRQTVERSTNIGKSQSAGQASPG